MIVISLSLSFCQKNHRLWSSNDVMANLIFATSRRPNFNYIRQEFLFDNLIAFVWKLDCLFAFALALAFACQQLWPNMYLHPTLVKMKVNTSNKLSQPNLFAFFSSLFFALYTTRRHIISISFWFFKYGRHSERKKKKKK